MDQSFPNRTVNDKTGLVHAFILDGTGGGTPAGWDEINGWEQSQGVLWIHCDYSAEDVQNWIRNRSGLDDISAEALLTEETRPRTSIIGDAALLALRGVNLNPSAEPEDMVSVRVWIDRHRIITTRKRVLLSVADIVSSLGSGTGPAAPGDFIADLAGRLTSRMEGTIEEIEDRLDQIEDEAITTGAHSLRSELIAVRREAIMLRRYLAPQREAMSKLHAEKISWLSDADRMLLRETTDRVMRYIEDLDSVKDRASLIQEELVNRLSEQMNARMYVLSLVAAIFLPLGFLTGLLGINVGGIPGAENSSAFAIFIVILFVLVFFQLLIFKRNKWL